MLEALFAAARLGAIAIPINARLTAPEVAFQLDDSTPRVLLVEHRWQARAEQACGMAKHPPRTRLVVGTNGHGRDAYEDALASQGASAECQAVSPEAPMILMYTSGTTGKPKGALLPHRKSLYNSLNAQLFFDIAQPTACSSSPPSSTPSDCRSSLCRRSMRGPVSSSRRASRRNASGGPSSRSASAISEGSRRCTSACSRPCARGPLLRRVPESLRFAFTAGSAAPPELIRDFHALGLLMKQGYGQTETSILTCLEPEDALEKAGSVGRPVFHGELRLVDPATIEGPVEDWRDVEVSAIGEIVVRGPITMLGYWQRPAATAETLRGEWLRTGDLATRDPDFDLTLVGRAREMYISGGENVYPAEIEATLVEHPDVREAAVVAVPDAEWGEVGHAHVVLDAPDACTATELLEWLGARLARFKQPRAIVFEPELPRTASGKIQKHRLAPGTPEADPR